MPGAHPSSRQCAVHGEVAGFTKSARSTLAHDIFIIKFKHLTLDNDLDGFSFEVSTSVDLKTR